MRPGGVCSVDDSSDSERLKNTRFCSVAVAAFRLFMLFLYAFYAFFTVLALFLVFRGIRCASDSVPTWEAPPRLFVWSDQISR